MQASTPLSVRSEVKFGGKRANQREVSFDAKRKRGLRTRSAVDELNLSSSPLLLEVSESLRVGQQLSAGRTEAGATNSRRSNENDGSRDGVLLHRGSYAKKSSNSRDGDKVVTTRVSDTLR